jgi:hypothetical protein
MLPKIDTPLYEITLPLSKQKIKFRPFLVKEEKILLMAMESEDESSVILAIKQIVNNCCMSEVDVEKLPVLDLEYFFLQLRARSVGENIDIQYKCNNQVADANAENEMHQCGNIVKVNFSALEVEPVMPDEHTNKIILTPKLGVVMKYPDFKLIESISGLPEQSMLEKTIISCIDYIYDEESIYKAKDISEQELIDFVDSLTRDQFNQIQNFFETIPKLTKPLKFKCQKCDYEEDLVLEGIQSFFV